ncbi:MAG: HIT domain-containing protein [Nanoarchaeota archaeon]|nr:HIT domain-containing protein [Nanoarchaeota archaeon]
MAENQPTPEELQNMSPEQIAELQKKNCVFCKIIAGEVPSHKVYEDDKIIAILDIYPSTKGHTLVMPKEHVPIMPLIPQETFKYIFSKIKYLSKGIKGSIPAIKSTVFIANGAAAGQQSPHFLFHIIPRDLNDGLDNFDVKTKVISQDELIKPLKINLEKMMQTHLQKEGKMLVKQPSREELAKILKDNPQLKQMIIEKPEELKKLQEINPQMKALFQGIDLDKLSAKLKEQANKKESSDSKKEESKETEEKKDAEKTDNKDSNPKKEESPVPEKEPDKSTDEDEKKKGNSLLDKISHMFTK